MALFVVYHIPPLFLCSLAKDLENSLVIAPQTFSTDKNSLLLLSVPRASYFCK